MDLYPEASHIDFNKQGNIFLSFKKFFVQLQHAPVEKTNTEITKLTLTQTR